MAAAGSSRKSVLLVLVAGVVWGLPFAPGAEGQTATTGTLAGTVRSAEGPGLDGVEITLTRPGEGWERVVRANREGRFVSGFLPPGEYEAFVERFGYVPLSVQGIAIRSGRRAVVELELRSSPPPITEIDRASFPAVGRERALSTGRPLSRRDLRRTPFQGRELSGILSAWSPAGTGHDIQGLPGRYTTLEVDGLRREPATHPALGPGSLHLAALPRGFLEDVELVTQGVDVEWGYAPSGLLRATTVRGSDRLEVEAFGSASGAPLGSEDPLGASVPSAYGPEVGVLVRGPIRTDTAHYAVGLQVRREARPLSRFAASVEAGGATFLELAGLDPARTGTWNVASGFGRLDWRLGPGRSVTLRTNLGVVRGNGGVPHPILSPNGVDGHDLDVAASLLTEVGERGVFELRGALESSGRGYGNGAPLPRSWIQEGGIVTGADPMVPGDFDTRAFRLASVAHQSFDRHQLKLGGELAAKVYREESFPSPADGFLFPDLAAFEEGRGLRIRVSGPARDVEVRTLEAGVFVQNRWTPADELTLTGGLRVDGDVLPWDEVRPNAAWQARTGFDRARNRSSRVRFAPRFALEWDPSPGGPWLVRGSSGTYHGTVDRALVAEKLADAGATLVRRTLGRTGEWPAGSDASGLVSEGRSLAVMGARFDAPRTRASELALHREVGARTRVQVGVVHRRTDFLPRRRDLNRTSAALALDQFGREIFGEVVREEGVVSIAPGSDRRYFEFDVVSALESDGWSRWWGLTAGLSFADDGGRELEAGYTFSVTRDNLPGFADGWPQAVHGRLASGLHEPGWVEGRSDLDVPHRLSVAGSLALPLEREVRLGALYAYRSGTPFTPGVRDALHGSDPLSWTSVAPITVPETLTQQIAGLASEWPCLRRLAAERNACRTEGTHELNLRLGTELRSVGRWNLRFAVDALNLLDAGRTVPDPALFVVDGTGAFDPTPTDGVLELPVTVNPAFGEPLLRLSGGRALRIGLEARH
jgi:hypothetical protein